MWLEPLLTIIVLWMLIMIVSRLIDRLTGVEPMRSSLSDIDWSFTPSLYWGAIATTSVAPERYGDRILATKFGVPVAEEEEASNVRVLTDADRAALCEQPEVLPAPPEQGTPYFKPGEPTRFAEYAGQEQVIQYLRAAVDGLPEDEDCLEPQLFLGPPGMGKTTLAKVTWNELRHRALKLERPEPDFIEIVPADIDGLEALDAVMERVLHAPGSVLFIDEIHDFTNSLSRKLYMFLQENRYLFHRQATPTSMPPVTVLAATTDYGALHGALKRRFIRHMLEPATKDQLKSFVRVRGRAVLPIAEDAVEAIVERTWFSGAAWEPLELYRYALVFARARQASQVELRDVEQVFTSQRIDKWGLRWADREVIRVLFTQPKYRRGPKGQTEFVCFAASETNLCTIAQLDKAEYRESIRPKLMSRGFLLVRATYGQALSERAEVEYGNLKA